MALSDLSKDYEAAAVPLRARLKELRGLLANAIDPEEIWHIKRRIGELTPLLTQMNELAELTARYYEPGYWRSQKYTMNAPKPTSTRGIRKIKITGASDQSLYLGGFTKSQCVKDISDRWE